MGEKGPETEIQFSERQCLTVYLTQPGTAVQADTSEWESYTRVHHRGSIIVPGTLRGRVGEDSVTREASPC